MTTEDRNPKSYRLDLMSTSEILRLINDEDRLVPERVRCALPEMEKAVEIFVSGFRGGGRIIYVGAGTSARLAVADAAELTPTYGLPQERFVTIIAGGQQAVFRANESGEDDESGSVRRLEEIGLGVSDVVVGLTASGQTPFVVSGIAYANRLGAATVLVTCNESNLECNVKIVVPTGPEVVTGSTRMKAATAQRMVLTMLSTTMAVRLGLVYDNLMVALTGKNAKCALRAQRIVEAITGEDSDTCRKVLERTDGNARLAVLTVYTGDRYKSEDLLVRSAGSLRAALREIGAPVKI